MTEYWQSQAKKFCEFCKCWLTDNKPSIEFHERGKKHKENVARKIKEVHKKGVQAVKDDDELKRNLQAIENAALAAYKKDVGEDAFNKARNQTTTTRPVPSYHKSTSVGPTTTGEPSSAGCTIIYKDGQPVAHCSHHWSVAQSPEGYYYYYNSQTSASQWDVPNCLQTEGDTTDETPNQEQEVVQEQAQESTPEKKENKEEEEQEIEKKPDQEKDDTKTTPKPFSPYGAWTTVPTIEPPSNISKENPEDKKTQESEDVIEDPEVTAKKTENKFKERETPKLAFRKAEDEVVSFKKRKLNSEKKRNIRQTQLK